jgi:hypothetical protein
MRLYAGSTRQFIQDNALNQIAGKLRQSFFDQMGYKPSDNEVRSWHNSLSRMSHVVQYSELMDHGIMLEYQIPLTSLRLDCMLTGLDEEKKPGAVIVELKQWEKSEDSDGEKTVVTFVGGAHREALHPSVQVGQYRQFLSDVHTAFYEGDDPVGLASCSYLHNYRFADGDPLLAPKFGGAIAENPLFSADHVPELSDFLRKRLQHSDGLEVLRRVEQSRYRPSRKLMDHVSAVIKGNSEYVLLDEQLVVYDKVLSTARRGFHDRRKAAIIVRGGPGTGKSVIAINLMADLMKAGYNAQYATGSRAFTETLRNLIGSRGSCQFKYFNSYVVADPNAVDVLICDESHRIRESSDSRFSKIKSKTSQVEEILHVSKVSVFFLDDQQTVRPQEIGSSEYIRRHAEAQDIPISEYDLEVQFRCGGSDAFVNWINHTLQVRRTANPIWTGDEGFDFRVMATPQELERVIRDKAVEGNTARLVAGFCWPWTDPDNYGKLPEDVVVGEFRRPWNAKPEARRLAKGIPKATLWANDPNGMNQVGCVYTAQGFEFDYVGVIFGTDLVYRFDKQGWVGEKTNSFDSVVKRSKEKFIDLVKNTYRVLLTRGLKGCYVCFLDKETEMFFRSRMEIQKSGSDELSTIDLDSGISRYSTAAQKPPELNQD